MFSGLTIMVLFYITTVALLAFIGPLLYKRKRS